MAKSLETRQNSKHNKTHLPESLDGINDIQNIICFQILEFSIIGKIFCGKMLNKYAIDVLSLTSNTKS